MGDMADYLIDCCLEDEMSDRMYSIPEDYVRHSDIRLKEDTRAARSAKIRSIRKCEYPLSQAQKWCLACWCVNRDHRRIEREWV